jgi:hypothetical protein
MQGAVTPDEDGSSRGITQDIDDWSHPSLHVHSQHDELGMNPRPQHVAFLVHQHNRDSATRLSPASSSQYSGKHSQVMSQLHRDWTSRLPLPRKPRSRFLLVLTAYQPTQTTRFIALPRVATVGTVEARTRRRSATRSRSSASTRHDPAHQLDKITPLMRLRY